MIAKVRITLAAASGTARSAAISAQNTPKVTHKFQEAVQHQQAGRLAEAEILYRHIIAGSPQFFPAKNHLGIVLLQQEKHEACIALYEQLLPSTDPAPYNNMAISLEAMGRWDEAEEAKRRALELAPNCPEVHLGLATSKLRRGDLAGGFAEFEWRHHCEALKRPRLSVPQWSGQGGQTIVLEREMGAGDTIQFVRYAPMVASRSARVLLAVSPTLRRLCATLENVEIITERTPPPIDHYRCPLMSLPAVFGTTLETIPNKVPYIRADSISWADLLADLPGLKVGLVWAGKGRLASTSYLASTSDSQRSMRLKDMLPLLSIQGCSFVSLQIGPPATQMHEVSGLPLHDVSHRITDWLDTANLISGLDLVITVDTGVAHLAGALGRPVWMLNRFDTCWRWMLDRTDSPWYPTMRIFRQPRSGDWDTVVADAACALAAKSAH